MPTRIAGLIFLSLFALSQGMRDAYFGHAFQSVNFLFVAVLAFSLSIIVFLGFATARSPDSVALMFRAPRQLLAMNVLTAMAWLCYLFGLIWLEPAVVATFHNGLGPLVILFTAHFGLSHKQSKISPAEGICYAGIGLSLLALALVVVTDNSGLAARDPVMQAAALGVVAIGGVAVTIGYIFTRWFTDFGARSEAVMGTRFLLALLVAGTALFLFETNAPMPAPQQIPWLGITVFALMVVPSFCVQMGVSRTTPLVAHVFRSLGPVCVFVVQQFDGRLHFSGGTLICIIGFSVFTIGASLVRGWSEVKGT